MRYQWGRKDPYLFPSSSEKWGATQYEYGKYPIKIYTIDGVLVYQEYNGASNKDKQPAGGIITTSIVATSMMRTIKNPISFYGGGNGELITQVGHTKTLWDYYWTSYSRGTDGSWSNLNYHNMYLDKYIFYRLKSIYDPCPYGFRTPSNGTYNQFRSNIGWILNNYVGGGRWILDSNSVWFSGLGYRTSGSSVFNYVGYWGLFYSSTPYGSVIGYLLGLASDKRIHPSWYNYRSSGVSVRCIDFAMLVLLLRTSAYLMQA